MIRYSSNVRQYPQFRVRDSDVAFHWSSRGGSVTPPATPTYRRHQYILFGGVSQQFDDVVVWHSFGTSATAATPGMRSIFGRWMGGFSAPSATGLINRRTLSPRVGSRGIS